MKNEKLKKIIKIDGKRQGENKQTDIYNLISEFHDLFASIFITQTGIDGRIWE